MTVTGWRKAHLVRTHLDAHRAALRALAVVRCPVAPSPTVAEVYLLDGQRWVWTPGARLTPAELRELGIDASDLWLKVASSVICLEEQRPARSKPLITCRKCRRTYAVDLGALATATAAPTEVTVTLSASACLTALESRA